VRRSVTKHSPDGFNFGYGGSGPADFALNVLCMFAKRGAVEYVYQDFKRKFIESATEDRLVIPRQAVLDFLTEKGIL